MFKITEGDFKNQTYGDESYLSNWPMLYILENGKQAYIGESNHVKNRMSQHHSSVDKRIFDKVHFIYSSKFNQSVTFDYESKLIQYIVADELYEVRNKNAGMADKEYYGKKEYDEKFQVLWRSLQREKLVKHSLEELENSDLFKYSPFKELNNDQRTAVEEIVDSLKQEENQTVVVNGMPGSGKTIVAIFLLKYLRDSEEFKLKSTYNRRERPVHGHCGWSRGRFYYRITTFEGRPWDARDPHKTTFMALKHAIRLSIWRKQKETPGVEKAPGVSSPQRKESGRSGRDDGELRFGVRPGHPRKAVTSISQAEALAHGLTHLHHLVFAAVLARELDWCAALQDAREDARPWGVVGIGLRSDVWVEVRRDNHRPAVLVTRVDDVVDMPHDVIGAAVRPQVVDDEEVILEEARLRLLALVERHRLDVGHDVLHAGLQRGEPEVDDPVGDCRGIERLTCAHLSPEEQPIHVIA